MPFIFSFNCPTCDREIKRVSSDFIGKRANCKGCGAQLTVPDPQRMKVGVDPSSVEIDYSEPAKKEVPAVTPETYWPSIDAVVPQLATQQPAQKPIPKPQPVPAPQQASSERPQSSGALLFIAWVVGFIVFVNVALFFVGFMNAASR